nr:13332_t:CDS:10 [Entrophospora candida]
MRKDLKGGISIVEMLFRCNYLALVGGGKNPAYPPNKVIIWDDSKGKSIIELEFRSLAALSSLQNHAILAFPGPLKGHIKIVDLNNLRTSTVVTSSPSSPSLPSHGHSFSSSSLEEINLNDKNDNLQPTNVKGSNNRTLENNNDGGGSGSTTTNVKIPMYSNIPAHTGGLSCIAVNGDGSKCASASVKGTLIRVFDSSSGKLLDELRRGVDHAEIYSIAFSKDSSRLCVSSDKGTVHIFKLEATTDNTFNNSSSSSNSMNSSNNGNYYKKVIANGDGENRHSSLSFMKELLPKYFSSQWSFAHFKLPDHCYCRCICGFGNEDSVIVICANGDFYRVRFDSSKGGECKIEPSFTFLKKSFGPMLPNLIKDTQGCKVAAKFLKSSLVQVFKSVIESDGDDDDEDEI